MGGAATFVPAAGHVPVGARAAGSFVRMKPFVTLWLRLVGLLLLLLTGRLVAQAQTGVTIGASTAPAASAAPGTGRTSTERQRTAAAAAHVCLLTLQTQVARLLSEGAQATK